MVLYIIVFPLKIIISFRPFNLFTAHNIPIINTGDDFISSIINHSFSCVYFSSLKHYVYSKQKNTLDTQVIHSLLSNITHSFEGHAHTHSERDCT